MAAPLAVAACRSTPLDEAARARVAGQRTALARAEAFGAPLPVVFPSDAYTIVFLAQPDAVVRRALATLLDDERRRIAAGRAADEPGVVYAFWIVGQPADEIKIGRSRHAPRHRAAEWERALAARESPAAAGADIVRLLFAFDTRYNVLAERLVHTALACEHLPNLRHTRSGRTLTEFFRIDNVLALRLFIALCVRYADAVGDQLRAAAHGGLRSLH